MRIADYIKDKLPFWPNSLTSILLKLNFFGKWSYGPAYVRYGKQMKDFDRERALLDLVNYAILHVPYYRKKYGSLKLSTIEEFEQKIDFIDKDEVMNNWQDFVSDEIDWNKVSVGTTGGTSGKPLKLVLPQNRYVHSMYFWHKQLKRFGWNYDVVGVIRNHRLPMGRDYVINPIMRQVIFDGFKTDEDYLRKIWKFLKQKKIKYLHAYPSSAHALLKYCYNNNLDVSFLSAVFLTSEVITDYQYHLIREVLNIPMLGSYGHSEKLCLAGTSKEHFSYIVEEDYGYTELITDGDKISDLNIKGEIVGTTNNNYYFPLIRYRTGDYAEYCEVSPNKRVLSNVEGRRKKALIYKKDGSFVSTTALNLHSDFYERINGMQYIQDEMGYLKVLIIKDKDYSPRDDLFIKEYFAKAMGGEEYVEIKYVDSLIIQPNGKFLPFISNIRAPQGLN